MSTTCHHYPVVIAAARRQPKLEPYDNGADNGQEREPRRISFFHDVRWDAGQPTPVYLDRMVEGDAVLRSRWITAPAVPDDFATPQAAGPLRGAFSPRNRFPR
jgi:hypothetical protein